METTAKRTLVKSAPELWELADDIARLEEWMGGFVGVNAPVGVEITERIPEQTLAWHAAGGGTNASIEVSMAKKGFGTAVEIVAHHETYAPAACDALERLLDELGSPDRRPFEGE